VKILIVEDSILVRKDLSRLLTAIMEISEPLEAEDVEDGIKIFEEEKPDLIILDMMLKNGTGIDVLKQINGIDQKPTIIVYSNFADSSYRKAAYQNGADYYVDKSEDIAKLLEVIEEVSII
jgi:DNA-binding NarL/FixJ family response regulator